MGKSNQGPLADRRSFLKLAAASTVAGGMATASTQPAEAVGKPKEGLYRETEHVRRYYELARS